LTVIPLFMILLLVTVILVSVNHKYGDTDIYVFAKHGSA